jgi:hypothetical protein
MYTFSKRNYLGQTKIQRSEDYVFFGVIFKQGNRLTYPVHVVRFLDEDDLLQHNKLLKDETAEYVVHTVARVHNQFAPDVFDYLLLNVPLWLSEEDWDKGRQKTLFSKLDTIQRLAFTLYERDRSRKSNLAKAQGKPTKKSLLRATAARKYKHPRVGEFSVELAKHYDVETEVSTLSADQVAQFGDLKQLINGCQGDWSVVSEGDKVVFRPSENLARTREEVNYGRR